MGADLYIQSKYKENSEKWREIFEELAQARDAAVSRHPDRQLIWTVTGRERLNERLMLVYGKTVNSDNKYAQKINAKVLGIIETLNTFTEPKHFRRAFGKFKKISERIQKLVSIAYEEMYAEGYFREGYGGGGILNRLGLSWWQDFGPLVNKKTGYLALTKAAKFIKILQERKPELSTKEWAEKAGVTIDNKTNSLSAWDKHHARRKKELIGFLQKSIELKEPIYCSI